MLTIIVPYRDREDHLDKFIPHMNKYLPDAKIVIVEQWGDEPFNRGRLLNIGFIESPGADYYVFHDVDMLPLEVDYSGEIGVTQLASSEIQQTNYLGGVTMFDKEMFSAAEGYHNDYFHRAEDNEMFFNLKRRRIGVRNRFGLFQQLSHDRSGPEFIPELWKKAQVPRTKDMLKTCNYELIHSRVYKSHSHIKVSLL